MYGDGQTGKIASSTFPEIDRASRHRCFCRWCKNVLRRLGTNVDTKRLCINSPLPFLKKNCRKKYYLGITRAIRGATYSWRIGGRAEDRADTATRAVAKCQADETSRPKTDVNINKRRARITGEIFSARPSVGIKTCARSADVAKHARPKRALLCARARIIYGEDFHPRARKL